MICFTLCLFTVFQGREKHIKIYLYINNTVWDFHCVKSVQIRSLFWSVLSCIRTEYRKILTRKNSVFGHFSHNVSDRKFSWTLRYSRDSPKLHMTFFKLFFFGKNYAIMKLWNWLCELFFICMKQMFVSR